MLGAVVSGPARQLDPAALGDHVDRLYRAAWALCGSREDAEDLVQETFAKVLAKPRFLRNDDDLGYLLRVLRNTFVSRHRTAMRRPIQAADVVAKRSRVELACRATHGGAQHTSPVTHRVQLAQVPSGSKRAPARQDRPRTGTRGPPRRAGRR